PHAPLPADGGDFGSAGFSSVADGSPITGGGGTAGSPLVFDGQNGLTQKTTWSGALGSACTSLVNSVAAPVTSESFPGVRRPLRTICTAAPRVDASSAVSGKTIC